MTFKNNITELKSYVSIAPVDNKDRIRKIIELYQNKKIVNFRSALNSVLLLSSKNKNTIKSGRPVKEYDQIVRKYGDAQPMTGRLKEHEEKQKRQKENLKQYKLDVILYIENDKNDDNPKDGDDENVRRQKAHAKALGVRYNSALKQTYVGQVNVDINEMFSDRLVDDESDNAKKSFDSIIKRHGSINNFLNLYQSRLLTIVEEATI